MGRYRNMICWKHATRNCFYVVINLAQILRFRMYELSLTTLHGNPTCQPELSPTFFSQVRIASWGRVVGSKNALEQLYSVKINLIPPFTILYKIKLRNYENKKTLQKKVFIVLEPPTKKRYHIKSVTELKMMHT